MQRSDKRLATLKSKQNGHTGQVTTTVTLGELLAMQQELDAAAESDAEKPMTTELLNDLEKISRTAAESVNFTYMPLNELAALQ